jgi:SAM-dependent methyltransferase
VTEQSDGPTEVELVAQHYDETILAYELDRLERHAPVEFGITLRALERWVEGRGVAIDVGVGSGAYSSWLAARGFNVHLVDISEKLLTAAADRLRAERREQRIAGSHLTSVTDLAPLADQRCDLALALGPLYHLRAPADRELALRELFRVLKPNAMLFAAGVNRLSFLRDLFRDSPARGAELRDRMQRFLREGDLDPATAPPLGFAHLTTPAQFEAEFQPGFERVALLGLESFTSPFQDRLADLPSGDRDAWLDIVEETAQQTDALGYADHFLYVGRRRSTWLES